MNTLASRYLPALRSMKLPAREMSLPNWWPLALKDLASFSYAFTLPRDPNIEIGKSLLKSPGPGLAKHIPRSQAPNLRVLTVGDEGELRRAIGAFSKLNSLDVLSLAQGSEEDIDYRRVLPDLLRCINTLPWFT